MFSIIANVLINSMFSVCRNIWNPRLENLQRQVLVAVTIHCIKKLVKARYQ